MSFFATACSFPPARRSRCPASITSGGGNPNTWAGLSTDSSQSTRTRPAPPSPPHRHTGEQTNRSKSAVRSSGPNGSRDEKTTTPPVLSMPGPTLGVHHGAVAPLARRKRSVVLSNRYTSGSRFSSMSASRQRRCAEQIRRPGLEGDHPPVAGQPGVGTPRVAAPGDHRGGLGCHVIKRDVGARHGALNGESHDASIGIQVRCERTQARSSRRAVAADAHGPAGGDVAKIDLRNGGRVGPGRVGLTGGGRERDEASVAGDPGCERAPELTAAFVDANPRHRRGGEIRQIHVIARAVRVAVWNQVCRSRLEHDPSAVVADRRDGHSGHSRPAGRGRRSRD